jgi:hypothetical protein
MIHPATILIAVLAQPELPARVMAEVSADRIGADVRALVSFGTRHTLSATDDPRRGIGAARRWLLEQLQACEGVEARLESFRAPRMQRLPDGAEVVNVVGVLRGSMPEAAGRAYYVVGHYDSINGDRMDPIGEAPGANDDASGTAVVLECARVLAGKQLDATIVFLCTAAEEQGLVGAKFHAEEVAAKRPYAILGVLNNDIVGDCSVPFRGLGPEDGFPSSCGFVRVFSEGLPRNPSAEQVARIRQLGSESDSESRQLARFVGDVSRWERTTIQPMLVFRADRFLRGGDHTAFNDAGFSAVRFTTPAEDYSRQHVNVTIRDGKPYGDLAEFVNAEYLANVARLNAAVLVHLANAPRPPGNVRMITAQLDTGTTLRWDASPEPDVAGYEVVYRLTTSSDWDGTIDVGAATEWRTDASKDNYIFGVRAYDAEGYRSPVAVAGAAPR